MCHLAFLATKLETEAKFLGISLQNPEFVSHFLLLLNQTFFPRRTVNLYKQPDDIDSLFSSMFLSLNTPPATKIEILKA